MITITQHCLHCQSDTLVRNGHAPNGKQLYRCRPCGRQSRENPNPSAYPEARREGILSAYQERSSLRGLTRIFGVSRTTVSSWIKKSNPVACLMHHLAHPRSKGSHCYNAGVGRTVVVCAQKNQPLLDLDCALPSHAASSRLCSWGSEQKDVSAIVGGYSRRVSPGLLLHRFLDGLRGSASRETTFWA